MKTTDRDQRLSEFKKLFEQLPGPKNVDRIRQAQKAMMLATEKHVRRYLQSTPERVPNWQGINMLRAALAQLKAASGPELDFSRARPGTTDRVHGVPTEKAWTTRPTMGPRTECRG